MSQKFFNRHFRFLDLVQEQSFLDGFSFMDGNGENGGQSLFGELYMTAFLCPSGPAGSLEGLHDLIRSEVMESFHLCGSLPGFFVLGKNFKVALDRIFDHIQRFLLGIALRRAPWKLRTFYPKTSVLKVRM